ncbi:MAG: DUF3618 domain-containing protein [Burkholderiaceae bacterium]
MNEHNKGPAEIERDIEQTRADVSATIDAIQSKLTPGQMMDQAIAYARNSLPADFGRNLADTTRNNPVPVALIGIGIAWLAMSGRQGSVGGQGAHDSSLHGLTASEHGANDSSLHGLAASEQSGEASMTERARRISREARSRVSETVEGARSAMHDATDRSRQSYDRARAGVSHVIDEQPLVLGALGLAVGAALGAMLPRTESEDEWLGDVSDRAKASAVDTAREYTDLAADKTRQALDRSSGGGVRGGPDRVGDTREPSAARSG